MGVEPGLKPVTFIESSQTVTYTLRKNNIYVTGA